MPTEANIVGGHKATLHNANTSAEAKEHSKQILEDEHNRKGVPFYLYCLMKLTKTLQVIVDGNQVKDRDHVAAGLKG